MVDAPSLQHAVAALQRGAYAEAERLCRALIAARGESFEPLFLLGIIAGQARRPLEAVELLTRAVGRNPRSADAHFNRGVALGELGRWPEALDSYERTIALKPDFADAHYNRGVVLAQLGRLDDALASYDRVVELRPSSADAHYNRGVTLHALGREAEALASHERALALRPGYANAHNGRGVALGALGRPQEALACFEQALALDPRHAEAANNLGTALLDVGRPADAFASLERALALKSDYPEAWYNRGNALRELHRHRDAIASYERALALRGDYASAHWNLADCCLMTGDFARGWHEYEWRWKLPQREHARRDFLQPLWLGKESLRNRTILLHAEMGLGDTLLFCRYAREAAALGARVVLEVQPQLRTLLAPLEGVAQIVARGEPLPGFDFHCPVMSLPLAFRTDLASIPARVPYVRADPERVAAWRARLGETTKPRVAIVWSGSAALRNDARSTTLAEMLPLFDLDADWLSLQKEVPQRDAALLATRGDVRHVGAELDDFADTAALVELCDVVVTVDTSVANLAGAMAKAVWILLPYNPHDWRWMLERADSPWYPTARLFRQPAAGDWESVVRRVRDALGQALSARG